MPFDEELLRDWVNKELDNDDTLLQSRDLGQMTLVHDPSGSHSAYSQRYVLVRDSDPGRPANFRGFFQTVKDRTKMSMYGDGIDRKNFKKLNGSDYGKFRYKLSGMVPVGQQKPMDDILKLQMEQLKMVKIFSELTRVFPEYRFEEFFARDREGTPKHVELLRGLRDCKISDSMYRTEDGYPYISLSSFEKVLMLVDDPMYDLQCERLRKLGMTSAALLKNARDPEGIYKAMPTEVRSKYVINYGHSFYGEDEEVILPPKFETSIHEGQLVVADFIRVVWDTAAQAATLNSRARPRAISGQWVMMQVHILETLPQAALRLPLQPYPMANALGLSGVSMLDRPAMKPFSKPRKKPRLEEPAAHVSPAPVASRDRNDENENVPMDTSGGIDEDLDDYVTALPEGLRGVSLAVDSD